METSTGPGRDPADLRSDRERAPARTAGATGVPAPRRPLRTGALVVGAAAALVVGAVGGVVGRGALDRSTPVPPVATAPAGTLGAREKITMTDAPDGVRASASVVARAWGTQTRLAVSGLPAGATYRVVLVATDGRAVTAGSFMASAAPVTCDLGAAVLRPDVAHVDVVDSSGSTVMTSDLPAVPA